MMYARRHVGLLIAVAICLTLAACTGVSLAPAASTSAAGSGITGIAEAEPQCPIVSPGSVCQPVPVSKTVAVQDASGSEVTRFTTARDGSFRVSIAPGQYTLVEVVTPAGSPPSLKPVIVIIPSGQFVHVVLLFDTGIR
jgi:hypothetical protein